MSDNKLIVNVYKTHAEALERKEKYWLQQPAKGRMVALTQACHKAVLQSLSFPIVALRIAIMAGVLKIGIESSNPYAIYIAIAAVAFIFKDSTLAFYYNIQNTLNIRAALTRTLLLEARDHETKVALDQYNVPNKEVIISQIKSRSIVRVVGLDLDEKELEELVNKSLEDEDERE